jgi:alkanesulfonate monooxygenase SsuD/methylene tetrahydromethanopterin reductase-like flavin-dependent oxidoreductase (luciferase family)
VLLMPFHNPIRLAEDVATVDVISGGRFELGVGIGFKREEFSGFGVLPRSVERAPTNRSKSFAAPFREKLSPSRVSSLIFKTSR